MGKSGKVKKLTLRGFFCIFVVMEFGKGKAGDSALEIVKNGDCVECGSRSMRTLDFDVMGELEQVPLCESDECEASVIDVVRLEMIARGQVDIVNTFGHNGLGRA